MMPSKFISWLNVPDPLLITVYRTAPTPSIATDRHLAIPHNNIILCTPHSRDADSDATDSDATVLCELHNIYP